MDRSQKTVGLLKKSARWRAKSAMRLCIGRPAAVGMCALLCAIYVGILYVGYDTTRSRDEPAIIRQRFARVLLICALSPLLLVLFGAPASEAVDACAREVDVPLTVWLGLAFGPSCALGALAAMSLTSLLYLGPLVMMDAEDWGILCAERFAPTLINARALLVVRIVQCSSAYASLLRTGDAAVLSCSMREARVLYAASLTCRLQLLLCSLVQGPLAEEVVFRSVMCPLLYAAGFAPSGAVFISAIVFGSAHLHHMVDMRRSLLATLFIFTYTGLFGAYSAYLFMRTGHMLPSLLAHIFCNLMGLPDFGGIREHPKPRLVAACFGAGLLGFGALTAADAIWRPRLFGSILWDEA